MKKNRQTIIFLDFDEIRNPLLGAGQAWATYQVGKRLSKKGYRVISICSRFPNSKDRVEGGIKYQHIGLGSKWIRLNNLIYIFSIPFYVFKTQADIFIECFSAPISTLFSPIFTKTPVIALPSMFNAEAFSKKYHLPFYLVQNFGLKFYKYFINYSDTDKKKALNLNPLLQTFSIPQGVEKKYLQIKSRPKKYLLFLGRLDIEQKGIDLLLKSYAQITEQIKYPLVIAGHGPDERRVRNLIKQYKLETKVRLINRAYGTKKMKIMSESLFVLFPSRHDEMCLWNLESLGGGLPTVAFDLPELKWLDSQVSLKTKPFNTNLYSKAMLNLSRNPSQVKTMSAAARVFASRYTWENVTDKFEECFDQVLKNEDLINRPINQISFFSHK